MIMAYPSVHVMSGPHDPDRVERDHDAEPLDPTDPRFTGFSRPPADERPRELVASRGPGGSQMDVRVRIIRMAIPLITVAGLMAIAAVFWTALRPGSGEVLVGDADEVAEQVAERPRRVCRGDGPPCAWLTEVDDRVLALNTSGPIHHEFGRQGVGWCPSSEYFGANSTGSRYDPAGVLVEGPARRGLDRFHVRIDDDGRLHVDFDRRTAGPRADGSRERIPPTGSHCDEIPFDRDPDLALPDA